MRVREKRDSREQREQRLAVDYELLLKPPSLTQVTAIANQIGEATDLVTQFT